MCVVCMDNDIQIYLRSTQTTSANKTCAQLLYNYLQRTPSMKEAIAAVYWEYYFYGRRNQNKPF